MKNYLAAGIFILLITAFITTAGADDVVPVAAGKATGNASAGAFNRYIFRGYELSSHSAVIQPALTVSYKGLSASMWGNIDTDEHPTQSFVPDREGRKSFNETDLTLSYTFNIDKLSLTGGYIYYGTKYTNETEELFISTSYDTLLKPTIALYQDINEYSGTYINLSVSKSFPLYKEISLDLGASAGYFDGNADYWKTYERSTNAYTGKKYQAFHDGMVKAGLTIPVAGNIAIQPLIQYWFPLSNKANKTVDSNSHNFNGKLDDTFVYGLNVTLSF
ncbi:MAG: hypothetical protein L0Y76_07710 [Ignavibacteria bacterium]|nr:hypothetical protein [Ignavibacteria bacterium]